MTINVNNTQQTIENNSSLEELISTKKIAVKGIAIAINNKVIPKQKWNATFLKENDDITIIHATQGG